MFPSLPASNWSIESDEKTSSSTVSRTAARKTLCARRSTTTEPSTRIAFTARSTRRIRKMRAARPQRRVSIAGMLDSRSIQPQVAR